MARVTGVAEAWTEAADAADVAEGQVVGVYMERDSTPFWVVRAATAPTGAEPSDAVDQWYIGEGRLAGARIGALAGTSDKIWLRPAVDGRECVASVNVED